MLRTVPRLSHLIIFCVVLVKYLINTEIYSALVEMENLYATESDLIDLLHNYIKQYDAKIVALKTKVASYEEAHIAASNDIHSNISDTFNSYLLTKRLTVDIKEIEDLITNDMSIEFLKNVTYHRNILKYPTHEDLYGAAEAILRLQTTYNLETSSLARGELNGKHYNTQMTASDCFEIGRHSYLFADYYTGMWMREAMNRLTESDALKPIISEYLFAVESYEKKLFTDSNNDNFTPLSFNIYQTLLYEALCSNKIQQPERVLAKLHCRYVTNKSPFLKIAPLKLEEAYLDPYIIIYHEVIYDNEIEVIKTLAALKLARATVFAHNKVSSARIGKVAFIADTEHRYVHNVGLRIEDMTGLTVKTAEKLQVVNYGLGGHYLPHYDVIHFKNENVPDRLATVLFYISDVTKGGATVFPRLKIAISPKKGTAVFWMNLYKSGKVDKLLFHGSCPVLLGNKWIANIWLSSKGQEWNRHCYLMDDHPLY